MADSLSEMENKIRKFCEARDWDQFHTAKDLAIGMITEAAELLELFRFQTHEQIGEMLKASSGREKIGQELADVFFFLIRFSQMNGFKLLEELDRKMASNAKRYPVDQFKGSNQKSDQRS